MATYLKTCARVFLWLLAFLPFDSKAQFRDPFPLSTEGRYIVNNRGEHFKLKSANWHGFHHADQVAEGLDRQKLSHIVGLIQQWGFNSIRLPFSNQMLHDINPVPDRAVAANPELRGMTPLQVFDKVVEALSDAGIAVLLNNHTTNSVWCCSFDSDGLWHNEDSGNSFSMSADDWEEDWIQLIRRYRHNPAVVGADLRNEVRTAKWRGTVIPQFPNWGKQGRNDWHAAATKLGNRILAENPDLLIVVEGINWTGTIPLLFSGSRPQLTPVRERPVNLSHPNKLVYAAHNYAFTGPRHTGDDQTSPGQIRYGQMDKATLFASLYDEFGFVTDKDTYYTAPVWVSEFGISLDEGDTGNRAWFENLTEFMVQRDLDFAYWPLNNEGFGLVSDDWSHILDDDWRLPYFKRLLAAPNLSSSSTSSSSPSSPLYKPRFDRFRRAWVADRDENLSTRATDWLPYSYKANCGDQERMMGLSQDHRVLCFEQLDKKVVSTQSDLQILSGGESAFGHHGTGDWAPGLTKYECADQYLAVGYAKNRGGTSGLLCARGLKTLAHRCETLHFANGDKRLSVRGGDWAVASYKAQCGEHQYLAGIASRFQRAQAILCCSLND